MAARSNPPRGAAETFAARHNPPRGAAETFAARLAPLEAIQQGEGSLPTKAILLRSKDVLVLYDSLRH